ncbi:MAG TPA: RNA-binding protein [Planctomycetota bacterium]|nr:RNA-binding protein [Planctomycetota bacterium]
MGKRLYVGNLPYDADEAALRAAFSQDGRTVERVHIVLDRETQRPRGFAFVEMATEDEAKQAMAQLDGTVFGTRELRVTEAEDRRPAGPGGPGGPRGPGAQGGVGGPPRQPSGSAPRLVHDDGGRNRFGPDARPKRERELEMKRQQPRRRTEGDGGDFHGRRGGRRFDDEDDE